MKSKWAFALLLSGWLGRSTLTCAAPLTYTYTPISVPGSTATVGHGLNNAGQIVGDYTDSVGQGHGFLYSNGSYTTIDAPGGTYTTLLGVNNVGQIVGSYRDSSNTVRLFLDDSGLFTTINVPGGLDTFLGAGINDAGQIVGTTDFGRAFRYDGGQFFFIPPVFGSFIGLNFAAGINNAGQIALEESDGGGAAFAYVYSNGVSTRIPTPTEDSNARGINNAGDVVGTYQNASVSGSYLYSGGVLTRFESPDFAVIYGINDAGQLIGRGLGIQGGAVLATPTTVPTPEPSSSLLLGYGLFAIGAAAIALRKLSLDSIGKIAFGRPVQSVEQ